MDESPGSLVSRIQSRLNCEETQRELQTYCEAAAALFDFTPEQLAAEGGDGYEQRHEWHAAHQGFVDLIERLLSEALQAEGVDRENFVDDCQVALRAWEQRLEFGFEQMFVSLLLDSGDYCKFVSLMKMHRIRSGAETSSSSHPADGANDGRCHGQGGY
eukprot:TRINITY_DN108302_c0_g1_i1.p1 TRINITY_DN108302_c0_g1~~TRINITY_DN108302_c0_g1_i1.p1  ORF type:complete len:173 (+),score=47.27 TRINITY_DN108302_c0_g1_i1:44-520(+)